MLRIFLLLILASCNPLKGLEGAKDVDTDSSSGNERTRLPRVEPRDPPEPEPVETPEERQARIEAQKKADWKEIVDFANEGFEHIKPTLSYKCFDCHDSSRRLGLYARIGGRFNPLFRHQRDGLAALDLKDGFPLKIKTKVEVVNTSPSYQISLLNSLKISAEERSMPLKSYKLVYRNRRIFDHDEADIVAWVDPIIERLEDFQNKYEEDDGSARFQTKKIFEAKCYRCHANNANRGGYGGMEDMAAMLKTKYFNLDSPEDSEMISILATGEMPPNRRERLTQQEVQAVIDWIRESSN